MPKYTGTYGTPRLDLGEAFHEYMHGEDKFIAAQVFGLIDVTKKEGSFAKLTREGLLLPASDLKRAPQAKYNRGDFEAGEVTYKCYEYGHEVQLDHGQREFYASDFDAEKASAETAWARLMLGYEQRVAALLFDGTTLFTTGNGFRTDVGAAWGTASTAIIADIQTAKELVRGRTGETPNALVIGAGVLPMLLKNDDIQGAMSNDQEKSVEGIKRALAAIFGLDHIIVGNAVSNTANEGQTATIGDVWGSGWASVCKIATGSSIIEPCVGRSLLWVNDSADAALMEEYEEAQTRSTIFRARHHMDELVLDVEYAQLLDIAA